MSIRIEALRKVLYNGDELILTYKIDMAGETVIRDVVITVPELPPVSTAPVDMLLWCPNCDVQHVDEPEANHPLAALDSDFDMAGRWTNPPHRSHLCKYCRCIWRPSDSPTNGVQTLKTQGKADTWKPL